MSKDQAQDFIKLFEQHKDRLLRICRVYSQNSEDQKDLFQEVVFNIWKSWDSFQEQSSIYTWLYRITLNVCMRKYYQHQRDRHQKTTLDGIYFHPIEKGDGHDSLETKEEYEQLYGCIANLKQTDKSIITLYLEELPYKEIASIIGISENYVAKKVKRIKHELYKCLKKEGHV